MNKFAPGDFPVGIGVLRFLFAVAVLLGHSQKIPGFHFVGGETAVESFYAISGFYMFMILHDKYHSKLSFYINRFLRLYPMYIVTVILTIYVFFTFETGNSELFCTNWDKLNLLSQLYFTLSNFSMLLIDLSNFIRVNFSDGSIYFTTRFSHSDPIGWSFIFIPQAWTLGLEIYFYLLVPYLARIRTKYLLVVAALSLAVRFLLWGMMYRNDPWTYRFFPSELFFFVAGGICFRIYKRATALDSSSLQQYSTIASVSIILVSALINYLPLGRTACELLFFPIFFLCLPFAFHCSRNSKIDRAIGELSYPVYIVHTLVISIVHGFGPYLWDHSLGGVATVSLSILFSLFLIRYVQNPIEIFRRSVASGNAATLLKQSLMTVKHGVLSTVETGLKLIANAKIIFVATCLFVLFSLFSILPDKLYPPVYFDLFSDESLLNVMSVGFGPIERDGETQKQFRWGEGPAGVMCFNLSSDKKMRVRMTYDSPVDNQIVKIKLNGDTIAEASPATRSWMASSNRINFTFTGREGLNILEIVYSEWNGLKSFFAPTDRRSLAIAIQQFTIESAYR